MAVIEPEAVNPRLSTPYADISGAVASLVRTEMNTKLSAQNTNLSVALGALEKLCQIMGNGHLSGGTIAAGAGLSVDIAALEAIVGTWIELDASSTVGGLAASSVNYLFLRQDGTWTVNQDGSDPTATHGDFLLWGTATTDGSGVTAVSNVRDSFANGLFHATTQTYTVTNGTTDRSFDADTVAVAELADVVYTLLGDLRAKGIVA